MKSLAVGLVFLLWATTAISYEIVEMPLDFSIGSLQLRTGQIAYGWKLMPWQDWLTRPTSGPLFIKTDFDKENIEVFEAHAAAIAQRPSSDFTEKYMHSVETLRKLNPQNQHTLIPGQKFTVESIVPFPTQWSKIISAAKELKRIDEKTTDYIKMESVFDYAGQKKISDSPELLRKLRLLDSSDLPIAAVNRQASKKINEIADFISMITVFYKIDDQRTLVVSYTAMAIKRKVLGMGFNSMNLSGRSILLGDSPFNTDSGLGAGLPKYFSQLFASMIRGFEN